MHFRSFTEPTKSSHLHTSFHCRWFPVGQCAKSSPTNALWFALGRASVEGQGPSGTAPEERSLCQERGATQKVCNTIKVTGGILQEAC